MYKTDGRKIGQIPCCFIDPAGSVYYLGSVNNGNSLWKSEPNSGLTILRPVHVIRTDDGDGAFLGGVDDGLENTLRSLAEVVPLKHARRSAHNHYQHQISHPASLRLLQLKPLDFHNTRTEWDLFTLALRVTKNVYYPSTTKGYK